MIHPPKQDESQNHTRGNPSDSGFRRDALKRIYQATDDVEAEKALADFEAE